MHSAVVATSDVLVMFCIMVLLLLLMLYWVLMFCCGFNLVLYWAVVGSEVDCSMIVGLIDSYVVIAASVVLLGSEFGSCGCLDRCCPFCCCCCF